MRGGELCAETLAEAGPNSPGRRGAAASGKGSLSSGMVEAEDDEEEDWCDLGETGPGAVCEKGRTEKRRL